MIVATGQFVVTPDWRTNAQTCVELMAQAAQGQASLLVLPEAILARDDADPFFSVKAAQPLDGGFLSLLRSESQRNNLTTVLTVHVPSTQGRALNTLVVLRGGEIIAQYAKLHLYDAFNMQESARVDAGQQLPPLITVEGMQVGLMTCYDLRFPDLAMALALQGAELLVLPSAWVRGPLKEQHWATLLSARALDTTCYIVASSECGTKNIGLSRVIDPQGVTIASATQEPQLIFAEATPERVAQTRESLPVLKHRRFAAPYLL
ncbi:deaminated glutathione amidase [Enterobacter sp. Bisph1]|uniref:deaminated glutathione amidase n=1 Tax=Enterobacter sp. Bisph1 TaxID=1274399 RepID=UPI00057BEEFF|nr:deaminated glutathione amidase [Enterobacter sp. Bisph1]